MRAQRIPIRETSKRLTIRINLKEIKLARNVFLAFLFSKRNFQGCAQRIPIREIK